MSEEASQSVSMFWWIFLAILILPENGIHGGILYPKPSESREIITLDGIWKFVIANRSDQQRGFEEKWYQQSLHQVVHFKLNNYW